MSEHTELVGKLRNFQYGRATCKGSKALGTACGECDRCLINEAAGAIEQLDAVARTQAHNAAFYRSCSLSGELPVAGDEPYPPKENNNG